MSEEDDELFGFKDFLNEKKETKKSETEKVTRNRDQSFELYSFLETESKRLSKLINFLEYKTSSMKSNPQDTSLRIDQLHENIIEKAKSTQEVSREDSTITLNLEKIFKSFLI